MAITRLILHIGRTGGTSVRLMLRALRAQLDTEDRTLLPAMFGHDESQRPWLTEGAEGRTFAIVFRDPDRRYASGFMTRLRQGRPEGAAGARLWSPGEAAAFHWFRTPDALFEALGSADDAEQSAAHFAMSAIFHVKRDHAWYLGTADEFEEVSDRFWFVRPLTELTEHVDELLPDSSEAVRERARAVFERRHVSEAPVSRLSDRSRELLRQARPEEYRLYETLVAEHARRTVS